MAKRVKNGTPTCSKLIKRLNTKGIARGTGRLDWRRIGSTATSASSSSVFSSTLDASAFVASTPALRERRLIRLSGCSASCSNSCVGSAIASGLASLISSDASIATGSSKTSACWLWVGSSSRKTDLSSTSRISRVSWKLSPTWIPNFFEVISCSFSLILFPFSRSLLFPFRKKPIIFSSIPNSADPVSLLSHSPMEKESDLSASDSFFCIPTPITTSVRTIA